MHTVLKIAEAQEANEKLLEAIGTDPSTPKRYYSKELFGNELVHFKSSPDALAKIYLPESLSIHHFRHNRICHDLAFKSDDFYVKYSM